MQQPANAKPAVLPDRFDSQRFQRLLDLVGPAMAPTLLAQLVMDLDRSHDLFETSLDRHDWDGLRRASHDLIALAGSCGALGLHDLAQRANASAHARASDLIAKDRDQITALLAALTAVIRAVQKGQTPW